MALALQAVGQIPGLEQLFPGTKEGKLLTAFDNALLGLLLNPDETFEASSKRHLVVDLAVLKAIDSMKTLTKATDGNSLKLKGWLIGNANVEKARRFGHDVEDPTVASQKLGDLKVPNFNALIKKGIFGLHLQVREDDSAPVAAPVAVSAASLSVGTLTMANSISGTYAPTVLKVSDDRRDEILEKLGYKGASITAEYVNGDGTGRLEEGKIYAVVLLNSHNSRDGGEPIEYFKQAEFSEESHRGKGQLDFLYRDSPRTVHLKDRHFAILKVLPHAIFPRAGVRSFRDEGVYSAARTLAHYGVRGFNDSPQWITSSARGIPEPVAQCTHGGISPSLSESGLYTVVDNEHNVVVSGALYGGKKWNPGNIYASHVFDGLGLTLPWKGRILEVFPLETPLPISKVCEPILLSNTKADGKDFRIQNHALEKRVQNLDPDKTYLFLQKGEKLQVGSPLTCWTTMDSGNQRASVVILTKEGRAIQTHTGSATVAIPLELNQRAALDQAKLFGEIDTVRRLCNEPMPNEADLKIALGISKAPSVIASHDGDSRPINRDDRFERDRFSSDVRRTVGVFDARNSNVDETIRQLSSGQVVGFQLIADDGFNDELLSELQRNFIGAKALMNGQEGTITRFSMYGIGINYDRGDSEHVDLEDVHRLQILGRADDDLGARTKVATNGDFLADDHEPHEIIAALKDGKVVDFERVNFFTDRNLDTILALKKVLFNGVEGTVEQVLPRGMNIKFDGMNEAEYKSLSEPPFKLQLLKPGT